MNNIFFKNFKFFNYNLNLLFFILIAYSQYFSPVISDDWMFYNDYNYFLADRPLASFFIIKIHYFIDFSIPYDLFKIIKVVYLFLSYFLLFKFFSLAIEENYSKLISFFCIFYPLHDSSNYQIWFITHLLCMIIPFYSFYLLINKKKILSYLFFVSCIFISYSALPSQASIITYNFFRKNYKTAIIFLFLSICYIFYYFIVIYYFDTGTQRIGIGIEKKSNELIFEILSVKNFLIHIFSIIDITIGPSHFIKLYYLILNNSLFTTVISLILSFYIFKHQKNIKKIKKNNFISIFSLVILNLIFAQCLFILSTKFLNIPFGLGNRVNIYVSVLISLIIYLTIERFNVKLFFIIILIFFLCFFGSTRYWSKVNLEIFKFKEEIQEINKEYNNYNIFLKNIEYVKLGPYKHIELINYQSYLDSFLQTHKINIKNNNFFLLKDIEINNFKNHNNLLIFDNYKKNKFKKINYIELQKEHNDYENFYKHRHWIQFLDISKISFLLPKHYKSKFIDLNNRDI